MSSKPTLVRPLPASTGLAHHRSRGQVVVMFALCATVLLLATGGGLDLAMIILERGRMQNAADSAALAAAQKLGEGGTQQDASSVGADYLRINGYEDRVNGVTAQISYPPPAQGTPRGVGQIVDVTVSHPLQASFWALAGVPSVTLQVDAQSLSPARRFDIFLSIDETASMTDSDMDQLRQAASRFVQTLNPVPGDPYSPKVALAAFQGLRYTAEYEEMLTGRDTTVTLADSLILTHLTGDAQLLNHLILGDSNSPGCSYYSLPTDQPWMPYAVFPPMLEGKRYGSDGVYSGGYDPMKQGIYVEQLASGYPDSGPPNYLPDPPLTRFACPLHQDPQDGTSGTFIRNGITAAFVPSVWSPYDYKNEPWDAFSAQHGGRDGSDGTPAAHRVLVVMTDGTNTIEPIPPGSACTLNSNGDSAEPQNCAASGRVSFARYDPGHMSTEADPATINAANAAKLGPDGQQNTADDIEIYTIGFYGGGESGLTSGSTPLCPATVLTPAIQSQMKPADQLLLSVSSSTSGSCDHYFPVAKSAQGLSSIFSSIAGRIKHAQLVK